MANGVFFDLSVLFISFTLWLVLPLQVVNFRFFKQASFDCLSDVSFWSVGEALDMYREGFPDFLLSNCISFVIRRVLGSLLTNEQMEMFLRNPRFAGTIYCIFTFAKDVDFVFESTCIHAISWFSYSATGLYLCVLLCSNTLFCLFVTLSPVDCKSSGTLVWYPRFAFGPIS